MTVYTHYEYVEEVPTKKNLLLLQLIVRKLIRFSPRFDLMHVLEISIAAQFSN